MLHKLKELPKDAQQSSSISRYEEPIFRAYSLIRLSSASKVLACGDEKSAIYCNLDTFLAELTELLVTTSNELTKRYF